MRRTVFRTFCLMIGMVFLLTGLLPAGVGQAQTESPQMACLRNVDSSGFRTIELEARVEGLNRHTLTGLTSSSLRVQENNVEYPITEVQWMPNRNGIQLAIIVDVGRPTNQEMVKRILLDFGTNYMADGLDQVSLYISDPSEKNPKNYLLLNTTSKQSFINTVNRLQDSNLTRPSSYTDPLNRLFLYVFDELKQQALQNKNGCEKFSAVWALSAPDNFVPLSKREPFVRAMMEAKTPVYLIQISNPGTIYNLQDGDRQIAQQSGGDAFTISADAKDNSALKGLFSQLQQERGIYMLKYQTGQDNSGDHVVELLLPGQKDAAAFATQTYTIKLQPPVIEMLSPLSGARLERKAVEQPGQPLVFDQETQVVEFKISWPDGHKRVIKSTRLELMTETGTNTINTAATLTDEIYQFRWKIDVNNPGETPIIFQVKVVDEFDKEWSGDPISMTIVNQIESPQVDPTRNWMFYAVLGFAGLVVVLLGVLGWALWMIRKQIPKIVKEGGVGRLASEVRKTLIGGGRRKVLAEFIIRQGPANLINQHLKVSTESVRLGRDPRKADFTFFEDSNSSISGLHCRVERFGGSWRVVAVSESGNETFIDESPIPFNQPVPIRSGQVIRMGYPAQQPVELEFVVVEPVASAVDDPRKTDVLRDPDAKKTEVGPQVPGGAMPFGPGPMPISQDAKNVSRGSDDDSDFDSFRDPDRK